MVEPTLAPTLYALTLTFAGSLAASLLAALRLVRRSNTRRSDVLAALNLAWLFALLSAASLVTFATTSAHVDTLNLLHLADGVVFSRPFILLTLGSLYLLPVLTLMLEEVSIESQTQRSSEQVHSQRRVYGTF